MKLALTLFKYFPYGGLQRNFLAIAMELVRRGRSVTVYTGDWDGPRPNGLTIVEFTPSGLMNATRNRSVHRQLTERLKRDPADVVVGFNKMPGLDVYYAADTCFAAKAFEQKGPLYRLTPRCSCSLEYEEAVFSQASSTEILLLSAVEGEIYKRRYATQPARFHLMPPGISRNRVRDEKSDELATLKRKEFGIGPEQKIVIFLGSDYKRKGLDRLLTAMAALPEACRHSTRLLIVGRDKRQRKYQALARRLGVADRAQFLGERDDIPGLLFASDLLVHPAYLENTGNVLLEAAVAGAPVICTGICGYSHYIRDNDLGRVIEEPFVQDSLDRALCQMLTEGRDWRDKCRKFTETADLFSRPQRAAETIEAIGRTKKEKGTRAADSAE
jgi:UDP-glucose:(heptosyl)LPS alpha-1,3-glucosyltransferase